MMDVKRKPKAGVFVVRLPARQQAAQRPPASEDFLIDEIAELPGAFLVRATDSDMPTDALRARLRSLFGARARVLNVLEDAEGHTLIPTGNISVLLGEALSKRKLEDWARGKHLRVVSRSKWRPSAVVLTTDMQPSNDIDETVRALVRDPDVEIAEQEVLTGFKREYN